MKLLAAPIVFAALVGAQTVPSKPGLYAVFQTSQGTIVARLYEKDTPVAVQNFVALAQGTKPWKEPNTGAMVKRPLYDNLIFHRVLPGLAIQSGDPTGVGSHDCGIRIHDEFLPGLRFDTAGRLAVANTGAADSGGCQFFITTDAMQQWNGKYTIFGNVVSGQDVADKISKVKVRGDRPVDPVRLITVTIERVGPAPKK
ncbi:MAG TPA: peptidylprolyl isomerase [Bryobacteraceae bacterium]|nr:peptidylprolyl isomerase [Bryobacteraceae bacterium]